MFLVIMIIITESTRAKIQLRAAIRKVGEQFV